MNAGDVLVGVAADFELKPTITLFTITRDIAGHLIGRDTLGLGAFSVGMLAASEGVGAFLGGLVIAAAAPMSHFRRTFVFGFAAFLVMVLVTMAVRILN